MDLKLKFIKMLIAIIVSIAVAGCGAYMRYKFIKWDREGDAPTFHGVKVELSMSSPKNAYGWRGHWYEPVIALKADSKDYCVIIHSLKVMRSLSDEVVFKSNYTETIWCFDEAVGAPEGEPMVIEFPHDDKIWGYHLDNNWKRTDVINPKEPLRLITDLTVELKNGERFRGSIEALFIPTMTSEYGIVGD